MFTFSARTHLSKYDDSKDVQRTRYAIQVKDSISKSRYHSICDFKQDLAPVYHIFVFVH